MLCVVFLAQAFPNEQLPVLEIDGFMLPQSMAMLRYVGKLGGMNSPIYYETVYRRGGLIL